MKNLVVLEDNSWEFPVELSPILTLKDSSSIVSSAVNVINGEILLLTSSGVLISQGISMDEEEDVTPHEPWNLNEVTDSPGDETWFMVKIVSETGSIVCVSHSGHIVTIASNSNTGTWSDIPEIEGSVESGIADASWCPDESVLVIATRNDTLLCMTAFFDIVCETPTTSRVPDSQSIISWRGDGQQFSIYSVDMSDKIPKVRVFSKDIDLLHVGRNVGEGSQAVVDNLLPAMAYSSDGSLVAVAQQRTPKKQQIVFFERSGIRHGEFDIQHGSSSLVSSCNIVHLEWNFQSSLLAVVLEEKDSVDVPRRTVQIYHRNNYHWYLKQQWSSRGLWILGFDNEVPDRLYLSEVLGKDESNGTSGVRLRVVNMVWDSCVSLTSECSCVVVDGLTLKVTPLGRAIIPPPMSKYQLSLPSACRHVSFGNSRSGWVLAALCDEQQIRLFWHSSCADLSCSPRSAHDIELSSFGDALKKYNLRSIQVVVHESGAISSDGFQSYFVIVCAACDTTICGSDMRSRDNIVVLWAPQADIEAGLSNWVIDLYPVHSSGRVQRIVPWATDLNCLGVGIQTAEAISSFEISKIDFHVNEDDKHLSASFSGAYSFSENCGRQLSVLKDWDGQGNDGSDCLFVGLSAAPHTSRLYVNDNLLSSSHISSFAANPALDVLMFVTASAKPLLQFASLSMLSSILANSIETNLLLYEDNVNEAQAVRNATVKASAGTPQAVTSAQNGNSLVTFALPRPVERGAWLVGSPSGSAKVILQMPRGNLEGCEPRPLVLMRSRLLLEDCKYMECLLLLRRQRVDLNLLVDHDPVKFLASSPEFVSSAVETKNAEYLSLLVSSLENGNVSCSKYPIPSLYALQGTPGADGAQAFDWDNKVNEVSKRLRACLFEYIEKIPNSKESNDFCEAVLPLLCTYAKQQPALLAEALFLVKRYALGMSLSPTLTDHDVVIAKQLTATEVSSALSRPKAVKCLKYLAFLCDFEDLYRAALANCDFDMARSIARQGGNMDPKEYLPVLSKLQSYHSSSSDMGDRNFILDVKDTSKDCDSARVGSYCFMRFKVFVHLEMFNEAIDWALQCVRVLASPVSSLDTGPLDETNEKALFDGILSIATQHKLHPSCISALRGIQSEVSASSSKDKRAKLTLSEISARRAAKGKGSKIVSKLLSKIFFSFGEFCHTQGRYEEAMAAFLSSSEPMAPRCAVQSAIVNGDWHDAIAIGGRFHVEGEDDDDLEEEEASLFSANQVKSLNPKRIAQEIIEEYKSSLEQGLGGIESKEYISIFASTSKSSCVTDTSPSLSHLSGDSQASSIASLCVEYFNDVEGGVGILLLAKAWKAAAQMALRHRRQDLLAEDVGGAVKFEAKAMLRLLPVRAEKQREIISKLHELWKDPVGRLEAVSGVDSGLLAALRGEEESPEDTKSDFGGGMSVYSNMSLASNLTHQSSSSTASQTLSMLSDSMMSQMSVTSRGTGYYSSRKPSPSSFSVVGLEHNLLSRGNVESADEASLGEDASRPHETNKQKRLRKKKEMKGKKQTRERDVFGLKQEASLTKELYEMSDVSSVAQSVGSVCDVLVLMGGAENQSLACQLQKGMDDYSAAISAETVPSAPLYPVEWLKKREMEEVRWFQNSVENANPLFTHVAEGVWWRRSVKGLALWKQLRKDTLSISC